MNKSICALGTLCLFTLFGTPLLAQAPAQPPPPPPPHEGTAEFSFVGTGGNASTSALGLGGEYIVRQAPWLFRGKVDYVRNESDEEIKAEAFRGLFRVERTINERLGTFGQYAYLHDRFAGIESRNTVEGGLTYLLIRPQPHELNIDAGFGYAHENRVAGDNISTGQFLAGARYKFALSATADITDDLAYSISLSDSADWRLANSAAITVKIASIFSLKVSNIVRYVNAPVVTFKNTDTITSVALVAKF
jgi:putative salt-induced outer membrane protein